MMRTNLGFAFTSLMFACLVALGFAACSDDKKRESKSKTEVVEADPPVETKVYAIKFSHVVGREAPKGKAAEFFAKRAEELSNGRLKVEVFPAAKLVDDDKVFSEIKRNNIQMAAPGFAKFTPVVREFNVWDIPLLFRDLDHLHRVTDGEIGQELKDKVKENGFVALDYWDAGFKHFSSSKAPIVLPDDMKGHKVRIAESRVIEEQTRAFGGIPQVMNFGEVYSALQAGIVDSAENPLSNFYNSKLYEVQSSLTLTNHGYLGYLVIVGEKFWADLPEDLKAVFQQALSEATAFEREETRRDEKVLLSNLEEYAKRTGKLEIITLSPSQKKQWEDMLVGIYPRFYGVVDQDLIERIQAVK